MYRKYRSHPSRFWRNRIHYSLLHSIIGFFSSHGSRRRRRRPFLPSPPPRSVDPGCRFRLCPWRRRAVLPSPPQSPCPRRAGRAGPGRRRRCRRSRPVPWRCAGHQRRSDPGCRRTRRPCWLPHGALPPLLLPCSLLGPRHRPIRCRPAQGVAAGCPTVPCRPSYSPAVGWAPVAARSAAQGGQGAGVAPAPDGAPLQQASTLLDAPQGAAAAPAAAWRALRRELDALAAIEQTVAVRCTSPEFTDAAAAPPATSLLWGYRGCPRPRPPRVRWRSSARPRPPLLWGAVAAPARDLPCSGNPRRAQGPRAGRCLPRRRAGRRAQGPRAGRRPGRVAALGRRRHPVRRIHLTRSPWRRPCCQTSRARARARPPPWCSSHRPDRGWGRPRASAADGTWWCSGHSGPDSGSHSCYWSWRYALAILLRPMARAHPDVAGSGSGGPRPQPQPAAMFAASAPLFAPFWTPPAPPSQQPTWPGGWDQAALAQSFSATGRTPPVSTESIADSGASFHTTPHAGILFLSFHHGW
ncbi:hypothetical protein PVAP13_9KG211985 [Panicum virgatum]|uniref:Uncharacterized protein n=1 Tax=Panicum virgatum TaxID=38727 RepID=A0A8T0NNC1_PANVG|nr:hypothetical protein PVAP13_9KG211985 [Panicum virgatum]